MVRTVEMWITTSLCVAGVTRGSINEAARVRQRDSKEIQCLGGTLDPSACRTALSEDQANGKGGTWAYSVT